MIHHGSLRTRSRIFVALLAVWMTVFAVVAAVHNHGPLFGPPSGGASLDRTALGTSPAGHCFACLASHVPVPVANGRITFSVPHREQVARSIPGVSVVTSQFYRSFPARAPPSTPATNA
jgi:hypothetical protein